MLKSRQTVYAVMRNGDNDSIPCGAWSVYETAVEKKGCYEQEMVDRGIDDFTFNVVALTIYDE
jgi:hypothetical protein